MRIIILFVVMVIHPFFLFAESYVLTRECNMPRDGDEFVMQRVEFVEPGDSCSGCIWDFSTIVTVNPDYRIRYSTSGDSAIAIKENRTTYNYRMQGDSLMWTGYENRLTLMRDSVAAVALRFPFGLGHKLEQDFYFKGTYSQTKEIAARGRSTVTADAMGIIYLPEGDTLRNVLRVKRVYDSRVKIFRHGDSTAIEELNDSLLRHIETAYLWYAEGYRYPVVQTLEHSYRDGDKELSRFRSAFICSPSEQTFSGRDDANATVRARIHTDINKSDSEGENTNETDNNKTEISLYNSGTEVTVTVSGEYIDSEIAMILTDVAGRVFDSIPRQRATDIYVQTVSISSLPDGDYLLYIQVDTDTYIRKFSKK